MGRFDYVKYDEQSAQLQAEFKGLFECLEEQVNTLADGRAKSLVFTKLEEAYMWVGKSIRDAQVLQRTAVEQPARDNS